MSAMDKGSNGPMGQWANGPVEWTNGARDQSAVDELLKDLPRPTPDGARSARVRARCHEAMNRRVVKRPLESAVVGGFCVVYFTGVALMALRTHGLL